VKLFIVIVSILVISLIFNLNAKDKALLTVKTKKSDQRVALVIGNNNYYGGLSSLKNPVNDARDMNRILQSCGFDVIYATNVTEQEFKDKIKEFNSRLEKGGVGLLFFAGHGVEVEKRNYLIPTDAQLKKESDIKYEAIRLDDIMIDMRESGNRLNIIILDACRDNPFLVSRGEYGGLAEVTPAKGMFVSYATEAGKIAKDNKTDKNGLFTKNLIKYMKNPWTLQKIFKEVRTKVYEESHGKQRPVVFDKTINSDFYFTPSLMPKTGYICPLKYKFGTAYKHGNYYKVAEDLIKMNNDFCLRFENIQTHGSWDNCQKISSGELDIGITQMDVLQIKKPKDIAILAQLYHEELHIIVRKDSTISGFSQLKNRRISSGEKGSGSYVSGAYLYEWYFKEKMKNPSYTKLTTAIDKLKKGEIDAIISVVGSPANAFNARDMSDLKLVPFDISLRDEAREKYKESSIYYEWIEEKVRTISTISVLVAKETHNTQSPRVKEFIKKLNGAYRNNLRKKSDELNAPLPKWREERIKTKLPNELKWHSSAEIR
jgi:TRAP transporter TAXI family solute receptor